MQRETSFGIIPLRKVNTEWEVFLIQHHSGHWTLPKGRPEANETERQTAERELTEETGLTIQEFLPYPKLQERYLFFRRGMLTEKYVHYFYATVTGTVRLQQSEVYDGAWMTIAAAIRLATYPEARNLLNNVNATLVKEVS